MIIRATVIPFLLYFINYSLAVIDKSKIGFNCTARFKSKEFVLGDVEENFFQAYLNCKNGDLDLASITSSQEAKDLAVFLKDKNKIGGFWLSGTNLANVSGSEYSWLTGGKNASYTNWLNHEPNNYGGEENCIQWVQRLGKTGWNDYPCQTKIRYICEIPENT